MTDIRIDVGAPDRETQSVDAPGTIKVEEFLHEMIQLLQLAPGNWTIVDRDTSLQLQRDKSLEENGVRAGHHLDISQESEPPLPKTIRCPSCGAENSPGKKFCRACGASVYPTTADIRIHVHAADRETRSTEAPSDLKAGELLDEIVEVLKLPPGDWTIFDKDTGLELQLERNLAENGVRADHHLYITPRSEEAPKKEETVRCPNCGAENPSGNKFCVACGASVYPTKADIRIHVHTPDGETHSIEAPADIKVEELIDELIETHRLPRTDRWKIFDKDTGLELQRGRSLEENGVRAGHHLYITLKPVPPDGRRRWRFPLVIGGLLLVALVGLIVYWVYWPSKPSVSISVSPPSTKLSASEVRQFVATVKGTSNQAVNWSIYPPHLGSISQEGKYTAPPSISAVETVTITAKSEADWAKSAHATATLEPLAVTVRPSTAIVAAGGIQIFESVVSGSSNGSVRWSLNPAEGGITQDGVYTAPRRVWAEKTVTVMAISKADPTKIATATVTLRPPGKVVPPPVKGVSPPVLGVSPATASLAASQAQQFTATVTGSANRGVYWSIYPELGSISPTGLYTAPSSISGEQSVTVKAVSQADATRFATATIALIPGGISVSVSPFSAILEVRQRQKFEARVSGSFNKSVGWSIDPPGLGSMSQDGFYTAPSSIPALQTVKVTATSEADPTKLASASITLKPTPIESGQKPTKPTPPHYVGPSTGTITWSGEIEKSGTVEIEGDQASTGSLEGALPGVPVMIDIDTKEFAVAVAPSPENDWKRIVIRSKKRRHSTIEIRWSVIQ